MQCHAHVLHDDQVDHDVEGDKVDNGSERVHSEDHLQQEENHYTKHCQSPLQ